ncbi:aminotransferase class V-fold PLP-dependent enzyme [uncultured Cetobacterium sp.]|uniref:aminotransferase class V-fold PLP-dependent enzyme n=2 Tax=uncultured Cetobacterium sp. TaxID=527638 RepID=UPI002637B0BD|nr:aminotransferase class V-fold PLP-dependent enzyme [uncultured Cetobacterium sp.]
MIYLDNAATTYPKMKKVYTETMKYYEKIGINFSRNKSNKSMDALLLKKSLIENLRNIFSSKNKKIIINSSATFSLNEIIQGLDYSKISNIYISPFEHNSVYRIVKKISKEKNIKLEIIDFKGFILDREMLKLKFMSKNPDLVICTHASNVFGNILPIKEIFREAKNYSAITILDTAQTGGVLNFSEIENISDFIVFAGHKNLYGPSGIGGYLYNSDVPLNPLLYGGTGINSEDENMPLEIPERFEAGSPNILGIIGLKIATDEILAIGIDNILKKKKDNLKMLFNLLKTYNYDLKIWSELEENIGVISITTNDYSPQEFEMILNDNSVIVRTGLHCAPLAHKHMFTDESGTIRLSVGYFNDKDDFKGLEEVLDNIF